MNQELFEKTLREHLNRQPFIPFVVDLEDGQRIDVYQPTVAFNGGAASYLAADDLYFFECEQVRAIRLVTQETAQ